MVALRSFHEEPSLVNKPSGNHRFWLQNMSMPTADKSVPFKLMDRNNLAVVEQCLLEALGIV